MQKIYLTKVKQKNMEFYSMVVDPRIIVELLPNIEPGEVQKAQRPWSLKKVMEISNYVAGRLKMNDGYNALGIIPNNPILNIKKPLEVKKEMLKIQFDEKIIEEERYYLLVPNTKEEIQLYKGCIDAIDGQHRLIAFDKDYRDPMFDNNIEYNMAFSIFQDLDVNQRREIFMVTNEKQDKVSTNLIRFLKKQLGLLGDEEKVFDMIESLNKEPNSVLYNRIIIGEKKIKRGYKENQLSKIIKKSRTLENLEKYGKNSNIRTKILSNYMEAWEEIYEVSFQEPKNDTLTKISGIRYILFLFPEIMELIVKQRRNASKDNFKEIISEMKNAIGIDNVFEDEITKLAFRGEGATIKLAKDHSKLLSSYILSTSIQFDPTQGI